ncbi:MAG: IreB family regulatory phosphoprotein [Clostridia bacterium]|nr:IreB family regulatory phosphoprotein [Clostridia bacterium]
MNAKEILTKVYNSLKEGGYNPVAQISGYLLSGDPTYITDVDGARALICSAEREQLLAELVGSYMND